MASRKLLSCSRLRSTNSKPNCVAAAKGSFTSSSLGHCWPQGSPSATEPRRPQLLCCVGCLANSCSMARRAEISCSGISARLFAPWAPSASALPAQGAGDVAEGDCVATEAASPGSKVWNDSESAMLACGEAAAAAREAVVETAESAERPKSSEEAGAASSGKPDLMAMAPNEGAARRRSAVPGEAFCAWPWAAANLERRGFCGMAAADRTATPTLPFSGRAVLASPPEGLPGLGLGTRRLSGLRRRSGRLRRALAALSSRPEEVLATAAPAAGATSWGRRRGKNCGGRAPDVIVEVLCP
mmetsp:Transcript_58251/g.127761  ORF Transcript_58251/g.127761 Transcript_58251/m.127761 type:complete len:300 (-) Transcript_58251:55-954(-)